MLDEPIKLLIVSDSSKGRSGIINPSISIVFRIGIRFSKPYFKKGLIYPINTIGRLGYDLRVFSAIVRTFSKFIPLFNAWLLVFCIVGPSASGSLKGIPSSMISLPPSITPSRISGKSLMLGYPTVKKLAIGTSFFEIVCAILFLIRFVILMKP